MSYTYREIASNKALWDKCVDPDGLMPWESQTVEQRMDFIEKCFGMEPVEVIPAPADASACDDGHDGESWWEYDARGIPLARVCRRCREAKLAGFRKDVLEDPNYQANEPIEPEDEV